MPRRRRPFLRSSRRSATEGKLLRGLERGFNDLAAPRHDFRRPAKAESQTEFGEKEGAEDGVIRHPRDTGGITHGLEPIIDH